MLTKEKALALGQQLEFEFKLLGQQAIIGGALADGTVTGAAVINGRRYALQIAPDSGGACVEVSNVGYWRVSVSNITLADTYYAAMMLINAVKGITSKEV